MQTLNIDVRPGPYFPGSPVSGTVLLQGNGTFNVQHITITFVGRCKTKVVQQGSNNSRTTHRGRVTMFQFERVLFKGPYSLHAPHQWPFEFKFPDHRNTNGAQQFKKSSSLFNEEPQQPLPASFMNNSASLLGPEIDAFVRYELEAALITPSSSRGDIHVSKPLALMHHRLERNPNPQLFFMSQKFTAQSIYLLPKYQDRTPSFTEKLKATASSSKQPKAQYQLKALLPTVAAIGRPLPLALGITYDEDHSTTTEPPAIYLRKVKVQLESTTWVRCASGSMWSSDDVIETSTSDHPIDDRDFSDQNLRMTDRMEIGSLMNLSIGARKILGSLVWAPLPPNFRTFNIARKYALKVQVSTECGKQKHSKKFVGTSFTLLPSDFSTPETQPVLDGSVAGVDAPEAKEPPSYDVAVNT
ncbi:MAG: hypothetical protein Q9222_002818 [Ikaeria aurantiellina]